MINSLPHLNAALNATATVLLVTGWLLIKRRRIAQHRLVMISAVITSALFLTSYVIYHANAGSRPFPGTGAIRTLYFAILIPHVILAAARPAADPHHRHPRLAQRRRPSPQDCALDPAGVAVRVGDGSDRVRDALSNVLNRGTTRTTGTNRSHLFPFVPVVSVRSRASLSRNSPRLPRVDSHGRSADPVSL